MPDNSPVDFNGTWRNQHQSLLELRVDDGVVRGRFESGVGDDGQTLWVEIGGRALGDVITFNAVYREYRTIVTWIGQHTVENGVGQILTQWIHATDVREKDEHEWMWYSNRIGADVFTRV